MDFTQWKKKVKSPNVWIHISTHICIYIFICIKITGLKDNSCNAKISEMKRRKMKYVKYD